MSSDKLLPPELDNTGATQTWSKKLPGLLRSVGAIAILLSLYSFMMRGWDGGSDLIRYCMLLGHTCLLAVIALASGHFLKEGKGPRLLLMLAQVSVVVNFAILGAFIYFATTDIMAATYPHFVTWSLKSPGVTLLTTTGALLVLLPVIGIGFRTLARGMSRQMATLFAVSNLALLLPLRDPILITSIVLFLGIYTLCITAKTSRQRTEVRTQEGMVALLLQFLPLTVLLGRSMWLYSADAILFSSACIVAFFALRQCSLLIADATFFRKLTEMSSVLLAIGSGMGLCSALFNTQVHDSIAAMFASLLAAGMIYEISLRASRDSTFYRVAACVVCAAGMLMNLVWIGGPLASLAAIVTGVGMIVASYTVEQRSIFIGGVAITVAGLADQVLHIFQYFDFNYWVAMATAGVIAIVLASLLESEGVRVKAWFTVYRKRYSHWSY
jgi:hypothetical protein